MYLLINTYTNFILLLRSGLTGSRVVKKSAEKCNKGQILKRMAVPLICKNSLGSGAFYMRGFPYWFIFPSPDTTTVTTLQWNGSPSEFTNVKKHWCSLIWSRICYWCRLFTGEIWRIVEDKWEYFKTSRGKKCALKCYLARCKAKRFWRVFCARINTCLRFGYKDLEPVHINFISSPLYSTIKCCYFECQAVFFATTRSKRRWLNYSRGRHNHVVQRRCLLLVRMRCH